jgi:hypothetical protein
MWRLYPKEKALEVYTFIIEEENRNIQVCFNNFTEEEKELVHELVKKMRENVENDWKETKKFRGYYDD